MRNRPGQVAASVAVLLAISGCGEGSGTDVRTTAGPSQFAGSSAHFAMGPEFISTSGAALGTTAATELDVDVFESPTDCPDPTADAGSGVPSVPSSALRLSVLTVQPRPLTAGTYDVQTNDPTAEVRAWLQKPEGFAFGLYAATQGQIELSQIGTEAEGSVDLTLVDGTHLSGTFRATRCRRVCFAPGLDGGYVTQYCDA